MVEGAVPPRQRHVMPADYQPDTEQVMRDMLTSLREALDSLADVFETLPPLHDAKLSDVPAEAERTLLVLSAVADPTYEVVMRSLTVSLIQRALFAGSTWVDIGDALNMTPQGAYKLYMRGRLAIDQAEQQLPPDDTV